jgi:hypothetical protein
MSMKNLNDHRESNPLPYGTASTTCATASYFFIKEYFQIFQNPIVTVLDAVFFIADLII